MIMVNYVTWFVFIVPYYQRKHIASKLDNDYINRVAYQLRYKGIRKHSFYI